jgi:hypothetical protein
MMFEAFAGCHSPHTSGEPLRALDIQIPPPAYTGTPKSISWPYYVYDRFSFSPRAPFLAPAGCRNLAASRPVSSSDPMPIIGSIDQITDGDKGTQESSFVELGEGKQWVQIDLGQEARIYAIVVWHHYANPCIYKGVVVQVGMDPACEQDAMRVFNNDQDNSIGLGAGPDLLYWETNQGKLIDCKGVEGRYVRLWSKGNDSDDGNRYIEVEVWGMPSLGHDAR